ncbi:MAG: glycosyltransferase [Halochromatium sp.]
MGRALVIAKGSLGDIIPMYAVAQALQQRGHQVLLATQHRHLQSARRLGLQAIPLDQPQNAVAAPAAPSAPTARTRSWISNDAFGGTEHAFRFELETLRQLTPPPDLVLGNPLALSGPLVADHHQCPWVYGAISPIGLVSRANPCLFPLLHGIQQASARHPLIESLSLSLVRGYSALHSLGVRREQRRMGLEQLGHPRFEGLYSRDLNLLLSSPILLGPAGALPAPTHITGFTWLEPDFLGTARSLERALDFIEAGSPPILYTLGGNARTQPGRFFQESLRASRALGKRSLIVASTQFHADLPRADDLHVTAYLPYSRLFPKVAALVHSGGIGTIGWALRHGLPSLLVPSADDQFDNAQRAQARGLADVLPRRHYRAERIARSLQALLGDDQRRARLQQVAPLLGAEQGASAACDHLERLLLRPASFE